MYNNTLDKNEKIFLIPIGTRRNKPLYAEFKFKPYDIMENLLKDCNISYSMSDKRISGVTLVHSKNQKMTKYEILCKNVDKKYTIFFLSDVIDKVLKYYNVEYKKELRI